MRVVIVGAGLSGLIAGRELTAGGAEVVLLDKGRSPGGRLATRRIGGATLDHGAQFFTVRTPAFRAQVDDWLERGLVHVWNQGFDGPDGHDRFVASGGMNSLAKDLAVEQHVRCSTMAFAVRPSADEAADEAGAEHRWTVAIDDGSEERADAVIVTCPLPQAFALLVDSGVELDDTLFRTDYERTIALLTHLDRPAALPASGGVQHPPEESSIFSFIGDNVAKGVSAEPAVTFHANAVWSAAHWDDDADELLEQLATAARPWLGEALVIEQQLKKWRLATPASIWPDPCWTAAGGRIVVAGDAFAGPRLEGAHNSGLAAAHALLA